MGILHARTHVHTSILQKLEITAVVNRCPSLRHIRVKNTLRAIGPDHVSKIYFISKASMI